jgi:hypothetical protein
MNWPKDSEPSWHVDVLIAHRIIAQVLRDNASSIALWRVHRRAARDEEGHQFSLVFYASAAVADKIFTCLRSDPLLKRLKKAGIIIQDLYDDVGTVTAPNIEDTSDPHWTTQMRKSWPPFIMGVCQMWLTLIEEMARNLPAQKKLTSLKKMLEYYRQVSAAIKTSWQEEGSHALLHHLNAIFGYEPVLVREVQLKRF